MEKEVLEILATADEVCIDGCRRSGQSNVDSNGNHSVAEEVCPKEG